MARHHVFRLFAFLLRPQAAEEVSGFSYSTHNNSNGGAPRLDSETWDSDTLALTKPMNEL